MDGATSQMELIESAQQENRPLLGGANREKDPICTSCSRTAACYHGSDRVVVVFYNDLCLYDASLGARLGRLQASKLTVQDS